MNGHFVDLPAWDDNRLRFMMEDEDGASGESWRSAPTREACKALYNQWRHVVFLLKGAVGRDGEDRTGPEVEKDDFTHFADSHKSMLIGDAHIVAVKIRSSEAAGIYTVRMENASIIRQHAQGIYSGLLLLDDAGVDSSHIEVIRAEIDVFRELFKDWAATFVKDEFEDEWGLFV